MRSILLIEPDYKNKYPPIGLMKISTYHKQLGDKVKFFKGDLRNLVLEVMTEECISKLTSIDSYLVEKLDHSLIRGFIKTGKKDIIPLIPLQESKYCELLRKNLADFSYRFRSRKYDTFPKWDRVYITTLFTFYWKITVETINFAKNLVTNLEELKVGGVLASLLHAELEAETGIKPFRGLLDKPGILDPELNDAQNMIVDDLALDYSILDEIDYNYPTGSAYFTFMTKGCTRKCSFCSVPKLEPTYKEKISTIDKFYEIKQKFGEQQNLLLMDNNVLASPKFAEIIAEIKQMGFVKGALFHEPNQLQICYDNLRLGENERANIKRSKKLLNSLLPRLKGSVKQTYYEILLGHNLLEINTNATKRNILEASLEVMEIYEKYRNKAPKHRYVDFNQGTDARYVTDDIMRLLSEIPIRPLRIAFDYWGIKDQYVNAVKLAAKYGINELSNYILYNFNDKPDELYKRLEINVELCEQLNIHIYSFPMKFIPLFGEEAKHRNYIGPKWNRKYIRAIQSILNVTKGIVAPGRNFFEKAFGKNLEEFHEILLMPETYIVYRYFFEDNGHTADWRMKLYALNSEERKIAEEIITRNDFTNIFIKTDNAKISDLLQHYTITRDRVKSIKVEDVEYKSQKRQTEKILLSDNLKVLTITPEYEDIAERKKKIA